MEQTSLMLAGAAAWVFVAVAGAATATELPPLDRQTPVRTERALFALG